MSARRKLSDIRFRNLATCLILGVMLTSVQSKSPRARIQASVGNGLTRRAEDALRNREQRIGDQESNRMPRNGDTRQVQHGPVAGNRPDKLDRATGRSRKTQYATATKWKKSTISYSINNFTPKVGKAATHRAIDAAFAVWAEHVPLDFVKVGPDDNPDIFIKFDAIDGPGGSLAQAYYPGPGIGGDVRFDKDEPWTVNKRRDGGEDLFSVSVHELGHSLGLRHSDNLGDVMSPAYYQYLDTANFTLPQGDIDSIQSLYGKRVQHKEFSSISTPKISPATTSTDPLVEVEHPTSTTGPGSTEPPQTTEEANPNICTARIDAATFYRDQLYIFSSKYVWVKPIHETDLVGPHLIEDLWPELRFGVDAVYENVASGNIAMFKDDNYYEYHGTTLVAGFPKKLSDMGIAANKLDAAVWWERNARTYLFKGNQYWRLRDGVLESGFPRGMSVWRGAPNDSDAAFIVAEGGMEHTYFVKGRRFWRFSNRSVRVVGHRLNFRHKWLGCPRRPATPLEYVLSHEVIAVNAA